MSEKTAIERGTAEGFLSRYNECFGTDFQIVTAGDEAAPADVGCADSKGTALILEITTTEDLPGDTKALLGRSNSRSIEALRDHNQRVASGLEPPQFSSSADAANQFVGRITRKLKNDYGPNAALVVRDTSGVDWDWEDEIPMIRSKLNLATNPFSRGIWLLSRAGNRLFRID